MYITTIILSIAVFILVVLCIFFIYTSVSTQSKYIDPNKCSRQSTEFGVIPLTIGNAILNSCGTGKNEPCTFSNIFNLSEAIDKCHQFANICTLFSYAPGILLTADGSRQGTMSIMSSTAGFSASTLYDTYTQQVLSNLIVTKYNWEYIILIVLHV